MKINYRSDSKDSNVVVERDGIGFLGLLTIVFVVAKILGLISWSWWWVFSPLWIIPAVIIGILCAILFVAVFAVTTILIGAAMCDIWEDRLEPLWNKHIKPRWWNR